MKEISDLIRQKGLKKKYIANHLGIRPETLSRKLKQPETFTAEQISELSILLETDIYELNFHVIFFNKELELNSSCI